MQQEKYPFVRGEEFYHYEFFSEGPKGKIKKVVRYTLVQAYPVKIYNLGFGDLIEGENEIDDEVITDNKDGQKVLSTVAATVIDFTTNNPGVFVFAKGSTDVRTRLYQMGITSILNEVSEWFAILGFADEEWQTFEKGKNYEAFLVKRK
jgi:hypothetical protein